MIIILITHGKVTDKEFFICDVGGNIFNSYNYGMDISSWMAGTLM